MNDWRNAALLLVGHGSPRVRTSRDATHRLAEAIRARNLFAEVEACFWKEPPFLSLDLVTAPVVYVIPNFAGEGIFTRQLIPRKLGLTGPLTERDGLRLIYGEPVGSHPGLPDLLSLRAEAHCARYQIDPALTALLVIGHGTRKPGGLSATPERIAERIAAKGRFAEVKALYIEQLPSVSAWPTMVKAPYVLAQPLLVSEGMHASEDLPPLFGLTERTGGPALVAGKTAWLLGGIGRDPEVVEMILDQVRNAEERVARHSPVR